MDSSIARVQNGTQLVIGNCRLQTLVGQNEALLNELAKRWNGIPQFLRFLERSEIIFNQAILGIPTGNFRDELTALNIKRMALIAEGGGKISCSVIAHNILDKIAALDEKRFTTSCNDPHWSDILEARGELLKRLIEILKK